MAVGRTAVRNSSGYWVDRKNRQILADPVVPEVFTLGTTLPVPGSNVGVPPDVELTPYTGPNAGGLLTITEPITYTAIDFGSTQIDVRSSDVHFIYCRGIWNKVHDLTTVSSGATDTVKANGAMQGMVNLRNGSSFSNRTFYRCTFDNISQWAPTTVAVIGYGYKLERCVIRNFGDGAQVICPTSRPDTDVDVQILGNWIGELSWWWAPTVGVVHPSTQHQHCDCIQWQGGTGYRVEGNVIDAHYSLTIGSGTPGSGSDGSGSRASFAPSTYQQGRDAYLSIVQGGGTYGPGQPGALLGGSVTGLMYSTSSAGHIAQTTVLNNWGSGGSNWLNAGDNALTGVFGTVGGNRIDRNQRQVDWALNISAATTVTLSPVNTWTDGSGTVPRKTG